jgi:hypothetical protein
MLNKQTEHGAYQLSTPSSDRHVDSGTRQAVAQRWWNCDAVTVALKGWRREIAWV